MDEGAGRVTRQVRLGGGPCMLGALAAALEPALMEAAGPGVRLVSVSLDFAETPPAAAVLEVEAWVERATRTLVFAAASGEAAGRSAVAASAVFSRHG